MKWDTLAECVAGVVEYASGQPYCVYPGGHATVVLLCVCCTVEVGWREREREGKWEEGERDRGRKRGREKLLSDLQPGQNPVCSKKKLCLYMKCVLFSSPCGCHMICHVTCHMSQFCMKPC